MDPELLRVPEQDFLPQELAEDDPTVDVNEEDLSEESWKGWEKIKRRKGEE